MRLEGKKAHDKHSAVNAERQRRRKHAKNQVVSYCRWVKRTPAPTRLVTMGKKKHEKNNALPSVSILTPTTAARQDALRLLAQCIDAQSYTNVKEWLLIDGTRSGLPLDRASVQCSKCSIRWIDAGEQKAIGALRQRLKDEFTGDIAVCCDDDDYYPPQRVAHAVERLCKSGKQLAGCTAHLVYDLDLGQAFQFKGFHNKHSTHNTLAFTQQYAKTHNYDVSKTYGEESAFLKEYTEPMVQLEYIYAVLHMVHTQNTYNKREHSMQALLAAWEQDIPNMRLWRSDPIAPKAILLQYTAIFAPPVTEVPDVVYYLGGWNPYKWKPSDASLGGSEQAVVNLSSEFVKAGLSVHVYGEFEPSELKGVVYKNWRSFSLSAKYKTIIFWRIFGLTPICMAPRLKADRIIFDAHDNHIQSLNYKDAPHLSTLVDKIALKSTFHAKCLNLAGTERVVVIPNGIRTDVFVPPVDVDTRDPYKCIYASDYARGLMNILQYAWPVILKLVPNATLDVYYGMSLHTQEFQSAMSSLLKQPGVTDHGRCSVDTILRAKQTSSYHLYFTKTTAEIDCISIRESVATGCIPVLSTFGVFAERPGVHINGDPETQEGCVRMGTMVAHFMSHPDVRQQQQKQLAEIKHASWADIARVWTNELILPATPPGK